MKKIIISILLLAIISLSFQYNASNKEFVLAIILNQGFAHFEHFEVYVTNNHKENEKVLSTDLIRFEGKLSTNTFYINLSKNEYNEIVLSFVDRDKRIVQGFCVSKLDTLYFEVNTNLKNEFNIITSDYMEGGYD